MSETSAQLPLARSFAARKSFYATRASAIFPLRLRPETDLEIVFANYWVLKNGLREVAAVFRVYQADGTLVFRNTVPIVDSHNQLSMRTWLGEQDFDGMVEVEILSLENIAFTFPAICGFYRSGQLLSVVHSAGRVRNSDEPWTGGSSEETNWTCKIAPGVVPFFHVFNGPAPKQEHRVLVRHFDRRGQLLAECDFKTSLNKPFSSQLITLEDVFGQLATVADTFVSVTVPTGELFPRLVVGNYFKEAHFLEVTHSFPRTTLQDFVSAPSPDEGVSSLSFLPALQPAELGLEIVSFPTNAAAVVTGHLRFQNAGETTLRDVGETVTWDTGGEVSEIRRLTLAPDTRMALIDFREGNIPSRLNASYRYSVRGAGAPYSSDLASGAKSWSYPPKYSHWGHGVLGEGFKTVVMLRNVAHRHAQQIDDVGSMMIYFADGRSLEHTVAVGAEACSFIDVNQILREHGYQAGDQLTFLSWLIKMRHPYVETFWAAYADDGRICAEHGF